MSARRLLAFFIGVFTVILLNSSVSYVHAQSEIQKLQDQINQKNDRLSAIDEEIKKFEVALQATGSEKKTLQSAINKLELERKKIQADISYTENKISSTDLEIDKLSLEIDNTSNSIDKNEDAIREILRTMNKTDRETMIEILLRQENISEFWDAFESLETVKSSIDDHVDDLTALKGTLEKKLVESTQKRNELLGLKAQYSDQHAVLASNKAEKDDLLQKTEKKEDIYQELLAEREAEKERFESELRDLEAQLQFILDPNTIPTPGTAVFNWPVKNVIITQYFGYTAFAQSGAYSGRGHNGMDFGVPVGTTVHAALTGKVIRTNSQVAPMCQYGKWVLIQHANGLTTLYGHLSVVSVAAGDTVSTGQIIGYSGNTGYATGPHLHFTVYASDAVEFKQYTCNSGITLTIPVAALSGYLNPSDYLPR